MQQQFWLKIVCMRPIAQTRLQVLREETRQHCAIACIVAVVELHATQRCKPGKCMLFSGKALCGNEPVEQWVLRRKCVE